ncbi:unnamed protein product [Prunus brigantina]
MAATSYAYTSNSSSQRSTAVVLALVSAIVLSPLYVTTRKTDARYYETKWSSGFVLPMVLAGLIIAIKTTSSSSSSSSSTQGDSFVPSPEPSWVLRIGSSSGGLAGVLVLLMLVLSWQGSVHEFFFSFSANTRNFYMFRFQFYSLITAVCLKQIPSHRSLDISNWTAYKISFVYSSIISIVLGVTELCNLLIVQIVERKRNVVV